MATLSPEQQAEMKNLVGQLGSITIALQQQIQNTKKQTKEEEKQVQSLEKVVKNVEKSTDIFTDINTALGIILETQQLILKGVKPKKVLPAKYEPPKVALKEASEKAGLDLDLGWIKTAFIAPFVAAGAAYIIDSLLSPEVRAKVRAFVGGLLGIDFEDINDKIEDFKQGVEIAAMAVAAYLAMRGVQGIAGLFRGRTGARVRIGGRWGALATAIGAGLAYFTYDELTGEDAEAAALRAEMDRIMYGDSNAGGVQPQSSPGVTPTMGSGATQAILDAIARGEGSYNTASRMGPGFNEYDTVYGFGQFLMPEKPPSQMTFNELYDYQTRLIAATRGRVPGTSDGTSATGKYQMVRTSLFGRGGTPSNPSANSWFAKSGLSPTDIYSPENQELLARIILDEIGLDRRLAAGDFAGAQNAIARQWASQRTASGGDLYGQGASTGLGSMRPLYEGRQQELNAPAAPAGGGGSSSAVPVPSSSAANAAANMQGANATRDTLPPEMGGMPRIQVAMVGPSSSATGAAIVVNQDTMNLDPGAAHTVLRPFSVALG